MSLRKPRLIVAGQVPPPFGGQNLMIEKAIAQFMRSDRCETIHLPFSFTPELKRARSGHPGKAFELLRVIGRLFRVRIAGPIDLFLYPTGGPQKVAMIRDLLLLPWVFLMSRRVVLHFHAAGIADQLEAGSVIAQLVRFVYRKAVAAIVMTEFGLRDPKAVGIEQTFIIRWRMLDDFDPGLLRRGQDGRVRLLHVGHLCADKGTPQLLQALAILRQTHPELELELVGECLPPFSQEHLEKLIDELGIRPSVRLSGLLTGRAKAEAFGRADLFVFPTIAPYESFGLVLVEAMAWKLPIVASRWRGNADVLTSRAGAKYFPVSSALPREIVAALEQALAERAQWQDWGENNRSIFEKLYRANEADQWLLEPLLSLMEPAASGARRILYVHNSADFYGASRSLVRLLRCSGASRSGAVVMLPEDGPLRLMLEDLGVRVVLDSSLAIISRYGSWIVLIFYRLPVSVWRLSRFIRKENIDLVHTNTGVILTSGLASRLAGVPHVWHMRESFREGLPRLWEIYSRYIRMVSDKIIGVSNATAAQFSDRSKVVVIHNGFAVEEFTVNPLTRSEFRQRLNIDESDLVTGCVGRIKWGRKGQEHLIQAAQLLKARGLVLKFLIVGSPFPGNEMHLQRLEQLARDLKVEDQIIFAGEVPDAKPAYANMDIFVLPSAYPEPFGGVVMEAMSMGLPVIATNLGGSLDQVVDGVTGFLVPPGDPHSLAERIERLANDAALRRSMGAAGRERIVKNFSLSEMVKKVEAIYDSVLAGETSSGAEITEPRSTPAATIS
ncbi:MAG: glycosyltransferase [Verrucomicrobiota bacterium]